ncbi:acetate--CoA ligase [Tardiphaga sp.]|uniref:acetate--CoA ligase n=1 Tax=Tardiphaga sp. TaxID=1926292 RepID=UPI00352B2CCA
MVGDADFNEVVTSGRNARLVDWQEAIDQVDWITKPVVMDDSSFEQADFRIRWFSDGLINASVNCVDRHVVEHGDAIAIVWEPDVPTEDPRFITYRMLLDAVQSTAAGLRECGVKRGDRVVLYMPMIPEATITMLACARIGAIHSVVFGGFSPDALADRIRDCDARVVVTADEARRGGKRVPLKANVDAALANCPDVDTVIVVRATGADVAITPGRDRWHHDLIAEATASSLPEAMGAEDPLFILYTSGSTGKPKGIVHTTGGYLLWAAMTMRDCFDYREGEVFWCAADVGWITGHTYGVYGALAIGATTVMYEGVPTWPTPARMWQIVDRHRVNTLFTAPTVLRSLMREGNEHVTATRRSSLRVLGSVGEPINPEAWHWYHDVVGEGRCPIVDMWWQTETGGGMIAPRAGSTILKPGSATLPLPGVEVQLVDKSGTVLEGEVAGNLVIGRSWPGQARTIWNDHTRFYDTYFAPFPGKFYTGDGARRDEDGYYWITGRVDDVINVSGHRMGTAEIEAALAGHDSVAEAAVVAIDHDVKGQGIYAYVTLNAGAQPSAELRRALRDQVRREIGPIATPDAIQFAADLPKTRSGKIVRRLLRKIASDQIEELGDVSTLADTRVVEALIVGRREVSTMSPTGRS